MTLSSQPLRLLAIDPGTRYWGLSVFEGGRLLDWRVRRATSPRQRRGAALRKRLEAVLRPVLRRYHPQVLVLKRCSARTQGQSRLAPVIAKHLQDIGRQQGLRIVTYTAVEVRQFFAPDHKVTRLELARRLSADPYPFLAPWYELERRTPWFQERYYLRMFFAIALGRYALHRLQGPRADEA